MEAASPGTVRVVELESSDLRWEYHTREPYWQTQPYYPGTMRRRTPVDPWGPCYTHDRGLVEELLAECAERAPLLAPVTVHLSLWEGLERTNGWACQDWGRDPDDEEIRRWEGLIALSGRRVEIHPAIARYVVPHEYGHIVEDALGELRYPDTGDPGSALMAEYAAVRGCHAPGALPYGQGTHHLVPGEIFANDFRTYVMRRELEFWPHEVPCLSAIDIRPELMAVCAWWDEALEQLREAAPGP